MNSISRTIGARFIFTLLMTVMVGLCLVPRASAHDHGDTKKVQETLRDRAFTRAGGWRHGSPNSGRYSAVSAV